MTLSTFSSVWKVLSGAGVVVMLCAHGCGITAHTYWTSIKRQASVKWVAINLKKNSIYFVYVGGYLFSHLYTYWTSIKRQASVKWHYHAISMSYYKFEKFSICFVYVSGYSFVSLYIYIAFGVSKEIWTLPDICHFFLHRRNFWFQLFSTQKRVNCDRTDFTTKQRKLLQSRFLSTYFMCKNSPIRYIFRHIYPVKIFYHMAICYVEIFSTWLWRISPFDRFFSTSTACGACDWNTLFLSISSTISS